MKLNMVILQSNKEMQEKFRISVQNKFSALEEIEDVEQQWEKLKTSINDAAKEIIPDRTTKAKKKWMTEEILNLMEDRRINKNNQDEYERLNKEIRHKGNLAKETWLKKQCEEMENQNSKDLHRKIKDLCHTKTGGSTGCLKSKDGNIIMDKDKILERWTEYIGDLYNDNRDEDRRIESNNDGPSIMEEEVSTALKKMKDGKAVGPDNITTEMIKALEGFGITTLTKLINNIYDTGHIPSDLSKSIFIALPKKPNANECKNHRTISLMSHVTKILLRIIMMRIRNTILPEIAQEQCGFIEGKGTVNALYIIRTIIERALEVQKDLHLCFIDYTKAFDKVKHNNIIVILEALNIDGKDLRIIKNMYWEQTAAIRIKNEISEFIQIKRGVRQGCVLSPDLFSLYSENIMRHVKEMPGISIGGHNVNNLRYADDTVLIAEDEEHLQTLLDVIVKESEKLGLSLNSRKTETMVVSRKTLNPTCNIKINGTTLRQTQQFKYLGTIISSDGKCHTEVKSRISQAKMTFHKMKHILTNINLSLETRKRVLKSYIEPILVYGCEAWTISRQVERTIEATEMWFIRRILRIPWTARETNEDVLTEANHNRQLITNIRRRQAKFIGHIMRKGELERTVTTGKLNGKRARGRQREKIMDNLSTWLGTVRATDTIIATQNRVKWRSMIAHASRQGTR